MSYENAEVPYLSYDSFPMEKKIGLSRAMAIGIGGMVGGGIFAVLGLAVSLAQGGTPVAFTIAGGLALITSYSYVKLSLAFPDRGGTVKFINQQFGRSLLGGSVNNLLWVSYIIMLSLYASAFGSYAASLVTLVDESVDFHIYASSVVLLATIVNFYSLRVVSALESVTVVIKLIILISFVLIGIYGLFGNPNLSQLEIEYWKEPLQLLTGGLVIFVAYEGFELIATAAPDIKNPTKNIPRAYYYSVLFVVALYIAISVVTVGSLPFEQIAVAQEYVLAEAAKPFSGQTGFIIIAIAALLSTFSAINATLYGGGQISYDIAREDELPNHLMSKLWNKPIGLPITAIATLFSANILPLESISTAGSIGFLIVFTVVNYIGLKMSHQIGGRKVIPLTGTILCVLAIAILISQQWSTNKAGVFVALSLVAKCFVSEWIYLRLPQGLRNKL